MISVSGIDLSGRTAIITGAARGIGFGIAQVLAGFGARVAITDLNLADAEAAAAGIDGAIALAGDVSDEASCAATVEAAATALGPIDILVNNAGLSGPLASLARQQLDDWQRVMDVNLRGAWLMSRAVSAQMVPRRSGAIVNIASVAGLTAFPASHAYGVSKAGVVMLTKTLATELARWNVRVNCVAPGIIEAPMFDAISPDEKTRDMHIGRIPMGRPGAPRDIGNAVAFLVSPLASYVSGVALPVDGGWTAYGGSGPAWKAPAGGGA